MSTAEMTSVVKTPAEQRRRIDVAAWVVLGLDIALVLGFGLLSDGVFLDVRNLQALAVNSSQIVLLATAVALILAVGEIDIALGAMLVASSVAAGLALASSTPAAVVGIPFGLLIGVLTGIACMAVSAWVVLKLQVNSFISSLAMLGIITGGVYVVTDGSNVTGVPIYVQEFFGAFKLFGLIPVPAIAAVIMAFVAWFVVRRTRLGVHMLATGSSRDAAARAGVATGRIVFATFLIAGVMVGLAGFIDLSRFGTTDIAGHQTAALSAIAGAVIGGTRLSGGRVSVLGSVAGALLASILQTGLVVVGLPSFYQLIAIGVVLIIAVAVGQRREQQRN